MGSHSPSPSLTACQVVRVVPRQAGNAVLPHEFSKRRTRLVTGWKLCSPLSAACECTKNCPAASVLPDSEWLMPHRCGMIGHQARSQSGRFRAPIRGYASADSKNTPGLASGSVAATSLLLPVTTLTRTDGRTYAVDHPPSQSSWGSQVIQLTCVLCCCLWCCVGSDLLCCHRLCCPAHDRGGRNARSANWSY